MVADVFVVYGYSAAQCEDVAMVRGGPVAGPSISMGVSVSTHLSLNDVQSADIVGKHQRCSCTAVPMISIICDQLYCVLAASRLSMLVADDDWYTDFPSGSMILNITEVFSVHHCSDFEDYTGKVGLSTDCRAKAHRRARQRFVVVPP